MFKANIRKFFAYALMTWEHEKDKSHLLEIQTATDISNLLDEAHKEFKNAGSSWGMGVVKYMEGCLRMQNLDQFRDHNSLSSSSVSSADTLTAIICFQDALELFEKMSNFLGCLLSAERLAEVRKVEDFSFGSNIERSNSISNSDLERRIKQYNMDLVIIENKVKQRVYVSREQGRHKSLQIEVIRLEME